MKHLDLIRSNLLMRKIFNNILIDDPLLKTQLHKIRRRIHTKLLDGEFKIAVELLVAESNIDPKIASDFFYAFDKLCIENGLKTILYRASPKLFPELLYGFDH